MLPGGQEQVAGRSVVAQFGVQAGAALITAVWSAIVAAIILVILKKTIGLRPEANEEDIGLDLSDHDEQGYILF